MRNGNERKFVGRIIGLFLIKRAKEANISTFAFSEKRPNVDFIINYFEKNRKKPPDMELLQKGHRAYQLIKKTLLEYNTK